MRNRLHITVVFIVILSLAAGWFALPSRYLDFAGIKTEQDITLGLDLQGGLQVLLQADPPPGRTVDRETLNGTRNTIERRVAGLGVSEPLIQTRGDDQIVVELPGVTDPESAIAVLQQTALLEIIDPQGQYLPVGALVNTTLGTAEETLGSQQLGDDIATPVAEEFGTDGTPVVSPLDGTPVADGTPVLDATPVANGTPVVDGTPVADLPEEAVPDGPVFTTIVEGRQISDAFVSTNQFGRPIVAFELDREGGDAFYDFTRTHVGQPMAIVVDKRVISTPQIQAAIASNGTIEGLGPREVEALVVQLKAGSLQVPLEVRSSTTVGPTLGQDSIDRSLVAGGIGLLMVALFMILFYRLPGVLSVLALLIYTSYTLSTYKLLGVTMTLAGIAGFILSIGMAIDANVLIFARLKEELRIGRTVPQSIEAAFDHAFPAIRDSNVSTIITCAILWYFGDRAGTSLVTGFAITLGVGVVMSFITNVWVSRQIMRFVISNRVRDGWWLGLERTETEPRLASGD